MLVVERLRITVFELNTVKSFFVNRKLIGKDAGVQDLKSLPIIMIIILCVLTKNFNSIKGNI